jgi:hypothetical protein
MEAKLGRFGSAAERIKEFKSSPRRSRVQPSLIGSVRQRGPLSVLVVGNEPQSVMHRPHELSGQSFLEWYEDGEGDEYGAPTK